MVAIKRPVIILGYIVGGTLAMVGGGAVLNAGGHTVSVIAAGVGLSGGMFFRLVKPNFRLELLFFFLLLLAAGFSFWLDKN